jgi:hypothetical protein
VRIESLQAELVKLEATAASHRADYERERDRADRLVIELLKATANTTREMAAKLEGEIAALRLAAEAGAGPAADVMAARGALDRVTIGVGEVHSVSADRRSREPRGQRQDVILSVAQEGVGGGHEVANPLVRWPPAW